MAGPTVMVIGLDVAQCASKRSLLTTAQVGEVIVKRNKKNEPQSLRDIEEYLRCLAQIRQENNISVEDVLQHLNYSRSTLDALENGNLEFIQYPLNYFFTRQYASYLKVPFPQQFLMSHFKPGEKK